MTKQISEGRKTAYYVGMGLMVIGGLMFLSVFITGAMNFGDFRNFESNARSSIFRGIGGMVLLLVGGFIRGIGARGIAGSGVILDPKQARSDFGAVQSHGGRHGEGCVGRGRHWHRQRTG